MTVFPRTLCLSLLGVASLLGGCGGEDVPTPRGEGVVVPPVQSEAAGDGLSASAAYCDDVTTWDPAWVTLENNVLTLINQRRAAGATCGGVAKPAVGALTLDTKLRCASRKHSKDMGTNNFFDHTGSDGSSPWQRMASAGYSYRTAAENIAAGYGTAQAVVDGWMASTGHCNNIMNGALKQTGIGYFNAPSSTYRAYWTQDFGTP
ncbi:MULTISPECIES: CAP domain-containing protein [Corallococcus]|uniref:CAP domain-containing protein n=1 Tax=Corallococcus TaxID=83461 RepID=UPI00117D715D|nr:MULTISPECIES: CAP domain-containing protein [Corallococcus]NBD08754.1 CAP domain-containing protein [Corallococcus silvisoli]TSC32714.1 CAP domain-containing protein [Corallococcus sp. Z5C101001]